MSESMGDKIKGKFDEVKDKAKETMDRLTGDEKEQPGGEVPPIPGQPTRPDTLNTAGDAPNPQRTTSE